MKFMCSKRFFWKQRFKQLWLREGDKNNKFIHAATKTRRKNNQILYLHNESGQRVGWDSGLQETMVEYFLALFKTSDTHWQEVIECMETKITFEQNSELLEPITAIEVKNALFHIQPDKSAGPDGFSSGFYQKFWNVVGEDIVSMTKNFCTTGVFESGVTDTNIVLVPKKKCPESMLDLRPISLCNMVYKVMSKVLANRLKKVIDSVISETHSAFIPGRMINDNIMLAYEVMHYMKRKTKGKKVGWL